MTKSEIPCLVSRKTSLTIRHRLTPARACSTFTRVPERIGLSSLSLWLSALPLGFFLAGE
jgi:hypothetical protein